MKIGINPKGLSDYRRDLGFANFRETILQNTVGHDWSLFGDKDLYKNIHQNGSIVQDNLKELASKIYSSQDPIETLFTMVDNNEYKLGDCHYLMSDLTHSAGYGLAEIIVTPQANIFARGIARANYNNQNNDRYLNSVFGFSKGIDNRYCPWFFLSPDNDEITTVREDWRYYVQNHLGVTEENTITRLRPPVVNQQNNLMTLHRTVEQMRNERPILTGVTQSVFEVKTDEHGTKYIEKNKEIIPSLNKLLRFMIITDESQNHRNHYYNLMCFPDGTNQITTTDIVMARHGDCVAIRLDQDGCICRTDKYSLLLSDDSNQRAQSNWQEGLVTGLYNAHYTNDTTTEKMHHWMFHVNPHKNTPFYYDVATGSPYAYQANNNELGDLTTVVDGVRYFNHHTARRDDGMVDGRLGNMKYPPMPDTPLAFAEYQETIAKLKQIPDYTEDNWYKLWFKYRLSSSNADTLGYSNQVLGNGQNHGVLMLDVLRNYDVDIRQYTNNEYNNIYDFFRTAQGHQERERVLKSRQKKDISSVWFKVGLDFKNSNTTTVPNDGSWGWMPGMVTGGSDGINFIVPSLRYETLLPYIEFPVDPIDRDNTTRVSGDKYGFTHKQYTSNYIGENVPFMINVGGVLQLNSLIRNMLNRHVTMLKDDFIISAMSPLSQSPDPYSSFDKAKFVEMEYLTAEATVKESFCMPGFNRSRMFVNRKTYGYVDLYSDINNQQVSHYRGYNSVRIADVLDFPVRLIKQHPFYTRVEKTALTVPALAELFARSPDLTNQTKLVRLWSMIDMGPITVRHVPPQMAHLKNLDDEYILPETLPSGGDYYTSEHRIISNNNNVNDGRIIGRNDVIVDGNSLYSYVDMFITDISTTVIGVRQYNDGDSTLAYARYNFGPDHGSRLNMNGLFHMLSPDLQMQMDYYNNPTNNNYISENTERSGYEPVINTITELSWFSFHAVEGDYNYGRYPELDTDWHKLIYANIRYAHPIAQSGRTYYYKYPQAGMGLLKMPYGDDESGYPVRRQSTGPHAKLELLNEDTYQDTSTLRTTTFFVEHLYNDTEINDTSRGIYTFEDEFALLSDHLRRMGPCAQLDFRYNGSTIQIKVPMVRLTSCFINGGLVPYSPHYTMHQPTTSTLQSTMMNMAGITGNYSTYFGADYWSANGQQSKYEQFNEKALNNKINLGLYTLFGFNPLASEFSTRYFSRAPAHSAIAVHNNPDIIYSFSHFSTLRTNDPFGTLHLTRMSSIASGDNTPAFLYTHNQWMLRALYHGYLRAKPPQDTKLTFDSFAQEIDRQHNAKLMLLSQCKLVFDKTYWLKSVLENLPFNWIAEFNYEMFKTHIESYRNSNGEVVKMKLNGFDDIDHREDVSRHLEVGIFDPELTQLVFSNQPTLKRVVSAFVDEFGEDGLDLIYWYFTGGVSNKDLTRNPLTTAVSFSYIHEEIVSIHNRVKQSNAYTSAQKERFSRIVGDENSLAKLHSDMEIFIATLFAEMSQNKTLKDLYKEPMWFEGEFDHRIIEMPDNTLPLGFGEMIHTQPWNRLLLYPAYKSGNNGLHFYKHGSDTLNWLFAKGDVENWVRNHAKWDPSTKTIPWYIAKGERVDFTQGQTKTYVLNLFRIKRNGQPKDTINKGRVFADSNPLFGWWSVNVTNSVHNDGARMPEIWDGEQPFTSTHLYQAFFQKYLVEIHVDIVIKEPMDAFIINRLGSLHLSTNNTNPDNIVDYSPALIQLVRDEIVKDVDGAISLGWHERKIYDKYNIDTINNLVYFIQETAIPNALRIHYKNEGWDQLTELEKKTAIVSLGPTAHIRDRVAFVMLQRQSAKDKTSIHSVLSSVCTSEGVSIDIHRLPPFGPLLSKHRLDVDYFMSVYGAHFKNNPKHQPDGIFKKRGSANYEQYDSVDTLRKQFSWGTYLTPKTVTNNEIKDYVVVNEIKLTSNRGFRASHLSKAIHRIKGMDIFSYIVNGATADRSTMDGNTADANFCYLLSKLLYGSAIPNDNANWLDASAHMDFVKRTGLYITGTFDVSSAIASGFVHSAEYFLPLLKATAITSIADRTYHEVYDAYAKRHFEIASGVTNETALNNTVYNGDRYYWYNRAATFLPLEGVSLYDIFVTEMKYFKTKDAMLGSVLKDAELINQMGAIVDIAYTANSDTSNRLHISEDYFLGLWNITKQRLVARLFKGCPIRARLDTTPVVSGNTLVYDILNNYGAKHPIAELFEVTQTTYSKEEWDEQDWHSMRYNANGVSYSLAVGHIGGYQGFGVNTPSPISPMNYLRMGSVHHYVGHTSLALGDILYDNTTYYGKSREVSQYSAESVHKPSEYFHLSIENGVDGDGTFRSNVSNMIRWKTDGYCVWMLKNRTTLLPEKQGDGRNTRMLSVRDDAVFISNNISVRNMTSVSLSNVPFFVLSTYSKLLTMRVPVPKEYQERSKGVVYPIMHLAEQAFHPFLYPIGQSSRGYSYNVYNDAITTDLMTSGGYGNVDRDYTRSVPVRDVVHTKPHFVMLLDLAGGFNYVLSQYVYNGNKPMLPYINTENNPAMMEANWYNLGTKQYAAVPSYISDDHMNRYNVWYRSHGVSALATDVQGISTISATRISDSMHYQVQYGARPTTSVDQSSPSVFGVSGMTVSPKTMVVGQHPRIAYRQLSYWNYLGNIRNNHYTTIENDYRMVDPIVAPWVYGNPQLFTLPEVSVGYDLNEITPKPMMALQSVFYSHIITTPRIGSYNTMFNIVDSWVVDTRLGANNTFTYIGYKERYEPHKNDIEVTWNTNLFFGSFSDIGMYTSNRAIVSVAGYYINRNMIYENISSVSGRRDTYIPAGKIRAMALVDVASGKTAFIGSYPKFNSYDRNITHVRAFGGWSRDGVASFGIAGITKTVRNIENPNFMGSDIGISYEGNAFLQFNTYFSLSSNEYWMKGVPSRPLRQMTTPTMNIFSNPRKYYSISSPSGGYDAYGDWFNDYSFSFGEKIAGPTYRGYKHIGLYDGYYPQNFYADCCVYMDEELAATGVVAYDDRRPRSYVMMVQGLDNRRLIEYPNTDFNPISYDTLNMNGQPYNVQSSWMPDVFDQPDHYQYWENNHITTSIYMRVPLWNIHESDYSYGSNMSTDMPLRVAEFVDDSYVPTFYNAGRRSGVYSDYAYRYTNRNRVRFEIPVSRTRRMVVNNIEDLYDYATKVPYRNVFTPHMSDQFVTNPTMYHGIVDEFHKTSLYGLMFEGTAYKKASQELKTKLETYMGSVFPSLPNVIIDSNSINKENTMNEITSLRGKSIPNTLRHTSRTFLNGIYTLYWDYIPLCYQIVDGLDSVAHSVHHYNLSADIRGGVYYNDSQWEMLSLQRNHPDGTEKKALYEYWLESNLINQTVLQLHRSIVDTEVARYNSSTIEWQYGIRYHLDIMTFYAMLLRDPSLQGYMGHLNPYNTNIVETEVITKIGNLAIKKLFSPGDGEFNMDIYFALHYASHSRDHNALYWPWWDTYRQIVGDIWDEYRTIHPPFSIDNTPVHSAVLERIRYDTVLKISNKNHNTALAQTAGYLYLDDGDEGRMTRSYQMRYSIFNPDRTIQGRSITDYQNSNNPEMVLLGKRISEFEMLLHENYSVRKLAANQGGNVAAYLHKQPTTLFVHVSAYSSILRWLDTIGGLTVAVSRNGYNRTSADTINDTMFKTFVPRMTKHYGDNYSTPDGAGASFTHPFVNKYRINDEYGDEGFTGYHDKQFARFGVIRDNNTDKHMLRPLFVLRNYFHIKPAVGNVHNEYECCIYFYTESSAVKYKDEFMMLEPSQAPGTQPLRAAAVDPERVAEQFKFVPIPD